MPLPGQNALFTTEITETTSHYCWAKIQWKQPDFVNDKIIILNKEVPGKFTTSDHYCIPKEKILDDNHDGVSKTESILFKWTNDKMQKIAIKLHCQFSHPPI